MRLETADFAADVGRRIAAGEPWWFPGLAETLVARLWDEVRDLDPGAYSTAAWLGAEAEPAVPVPARPLMRVEPLPPLFASRFGSPPFAGAAPGAAAMLDGALHRLIAGGAADAVCSLVRSVHCVTALGEGYDCSHSEPALPFSVFLSVPTGERHAVLRLAESLLHEAMHLQLSLIERHEPVVIADGGTAYSPWQRRERPVGGVLHGLYVVSAIRDWLVRLADDRETRTEDRVYVDRRRREIRDEIALVSSLGESGSLTGFGRMLAGSLLRSSDDAHVPSEVRTGACSYPAGSGTSGR